MITPSEKGYITMIFNKTMRQATKRYKPESQADVKSALQELKVKIFNQYNKTT